MHVIIHSLQLDHGAAGIFYPALQFFHKLGADSLILIFMGNHNFYQVVGLQVIVLFKISHTETQHFFALFQKQAQGILPTPYLMDAFIGCFFRPFTALVGVVVLYVEGNDGVDVVFCHDAAGHILLLYSNFLCQSPFSL